MDYVVIGVSNGTIFSMEICLDVRHCCCCFTVGFAGGFAIDVYCSIGQEWDHTTWLTLQCNDVDCFLARQLRSCVCVCLFISVSFTGNRIHFLLIGQWGAFKSIVYTIKMEKCHHFFVGACCCRQMAILLFLNFVPETILALMPNIESVAVSALNMLLCLLILCRRYHSSVKRVNSINKMVLSLRTYASVCGCVRCKKPNLSLPPVGCILFALSLARSLPVCAGFTRLS